MKNFNLYQYLHSLNCLVSAKVKLISNDKQVYTMKRPNNELLYMLDSALEEQDFRMQPLKLFVSLIYFDNHVDGQLIIRKEKKPILVANFITQLNDNHLFHYEIANKDSTISYYRKTNNLYEPKSSKNDDYIFSQKDTDSIVKGEINPFAVYQLRQHQH